MNKILTSKLNYYSELGYLFPTNGSIVVCSHYWFEYKNPKLQYFVGKCFAVRKKGLLSSFKLRSFCSKTIIEAFIFINSPMLCFVYFFTRNFVHKRMSFVFLRKKRKQ